MIYLTGDTHGSFKRFTPEYLNDRGLEITEKDYVIVCGDFGLLWEDGDRYREQLEFMKTLPFTLLWVQGNHENYDMIRAIRPSTWKGGRVRHVIKNKVILLERGQIFNIDGKTFFTFGGGLSHDIQGGVLDRSKPDFSKKLEDAMDSALPFRILRESWWPEEMPGKRQMDAGRRHLESVGNKVDYIITHCCSSSLQEELRPWYKPDPLTDYFEELEECVTYKRWYFGHYHSDVRIDDKHTLLYRTILPLEDDKKELRATPVSGRPKYKWRDEVYFMVDGCTHQGEIVSINAFGLGRDHNEPCYDIHVSYEGCLYKQIEESLIICKVNSQSDES